MIGGRRDNIAPGKQPEIETSVYLFMLLFLLSKRDGKNAFTKSMTTHYVPEVILICYRKYTAYSIVAATQATTWLSLQ